VRNRMGKESARPQALLYVVPKVCASATWPFMKASPHPDKLGTPKSGCLYRRPEPESPARGLRRTAVGRAPRATSTPPPAAPPRLASYNGTVGGTVGRASRARLSTPRQPTPLLSGTCLTSAGRPPLRGMLATEGPGHPEGYPGPVGWNVTTVVTFALVVPSLVVAA
jgi:hypothetical protein